MDESDVVDFCGQEKLCNHFMVWTCNQGYSVYRCTNCNHIDMIETFKEKEKELADLKADYKELWDISVKKDKELGELKEENL